MLRQAFRGDNVVDGQRALLIDRGHGLEILEGTVSLGPLDTAPSLTVLTGIDTQPLAVNFSQIQRYTYTEIDRTNHYNVLPLPVNWKALPQEKFEVGATVYDMETHAIAQFREYNNAGAAVLNGYDTPYNEMRSIESIVDLVDPKRLLLVSHENE